MVHLSGEQEVTVDKRTAAWLKKQSICADDPELRGYEERILLKIRELGYTDYRDFLTSHSVDEKTGEPWSLTEQGEALNIPRTPYIRYHTRWVESNAPKGAIR